MTGNESQQGLVRMTVVDTSQLANLIVSETHHLEGDQFSIYMPYNLNRVLVPHLGKSLT